MLYLVVFIYPSFVLSTLFLWKWSCSKPSLQCLLWRICVHLYIFSFNSGPTWFGHILPSFKFEIFLRGIESSRSYLSVEWVLSNLLHPLHSFRKDQMTRLCFFLHTERNQIVQHRLSGWRRASVPPFATGSLTSSSVDLDQCEMVTILTDY